MSKTPHETRAIAAHAETSAWPRRFALATLLAAVPLLFFGGTVTTLHAGLAIDGWLVLEPGRGDHFLWFYPIEKWFRDTGTFVEHTHRQIGSIVGLLAIATVVATFFGDRRRVARVMAVTALLAIVAQGILGGLRVLERSTDLAFLHGSFGQAVFALLGATVFVLSPAWRRAERHDTTRAPALRGLSLATAALVYAQIVIGAWLRHGSSISALVIHTLLAATVIACVLVMAGKLRVAAVSIGEGAGHERSVLLRLRTAMLALLAGQVALGIAAFLAVYVFVGHNPTQVSQALFPTLHVMGGAALLLVSVCAALWSHRISVANAAGRARPTAVRPNLGGA